MAERKTLFVNVVLPLPVSGTFTYRVPFELNESVMVGQRVVVQFGRSKLLSGLVKEITEQVPDCEHVKYILGVVDDYPVVNALQFQLWDWICDYYLCFHGEVMTAALPSGMRLSSESKIMLSDEFVLDSMILSDYEHLIVEALLSKKAIVISDVSKIVGYKKVMPLVKSMIDKKIIVMEEELEQKYKAKHVTYVSLSQEYSDESKLHSLMDVLSKRAYKQLEVLLSFFSLGGSVENDLPLSDVLKKADANRTILNSLIEKNVFYVYEKKESRLKSFNATRDVSSIVLTDNQQLALEQIHEGFTNQKPVLLHGVTSSGKTEIYIKLIREAVDQGRQVLYLLPEIALTEHIISRLKTYFGDMVGVYHSKYSDVERVEIWNQVLDFERFHSKKYQIVIGSRSSLFLPFSNLGLVIVDEEHDSSFKQTDPAPRYNARDLSLILGRLHNSNVLLGSATPSFESYFNALQSRYHLVQLKERYGGLEMPDIIVDDMRVERKRKTVNGSFGSLLLDSIKSTLEDKKQVILFQNRRGFAPRVECGVCHWIPQCVNCDVSMTYHKAQNILKCHYCGFTMSVPSQCPSCNSTDLRMQGLGTERVEEELRELLPLARIERFDADVAESKREEERIIGSFAKGEIDILVGTQMLSKGFDFEKLSLVALLQADTVLGMEDFRADERALQLFTQLIGRSGRRGIRGKMLIQSAQKNHPIFKIFKLDTLFPDSSALLDERREFRFAPYVRMVKITLRHRTMEELERLTAAVAAIQVPCLEITGPFVPGLERLRGEWQRAFYVKFARDSRLSHNKRVLMERLEALNAPNSIVVDVDPY